MFYSNYRDRDCDRDNDCRGREGGCREQAEACPRRRCPDQGPNPFVTNIEQAALRNNTFRTALWTGENLQLTLMCIPVGECIGLEVHPDVDQFICIVEGNGLTQMGCSRCCLNFRECVCSCSAVFVPAGTWHNITNTGNCPMKLFTIYAPPEHPRCTVHKTKADAECDEH